MICKKCGKEVPEGTETCPYCGLKLKEEVVAETTPVTTAQPTRTTQILNEKAPILENALNSFKQAKKAIKQSYLLAIFLLANLIVQILFVTLVWTLPSSVTDAGWIALTVVYAIVQVAVEVPQWIFLITMWINISYIKEHTKFNTKWYVIGLPILIGLSFVFSICSACVKVEKAVLAFEIINIFITFIMAGITTCGYFKIKRTLHQ